MFLGRYDFAGDPDALLVAYDRFMKQVPDANISFHICVRNGDGISLIDSCPSQEDFEGFSSSPELFGLMTNAGLPLPTVSPIGDVYVARAASTTYRAE
jgi:hypothetical protein